MRLSAPVPVTCAAPETAAAGKSRIDVGDVDLVVVESSLNDPLSNATPWTRRPASDADVGMEGLVPGALGRRPVEMAANRDGGRPVERERGDRLRARGGKYPGERRGVDRRGRVDVQPAPPPSWARSPA